MENAHIVRHNSNCDTVLTRLKLLISLQFVFVRSSEDLLMSELWKGVAELVLRAIL